MKKIVILSFLFVAATICLSAQPPQGGRPDGMGGPDGHGGPGGPPPSMKSSTTDDYWVENISVIEGLTLKQKNKLSDLLVSEQNDIFNQLEKKRTYQMSFEKDQSLSEKEISKRLKQMDKIDTNIEKIKSKSSKKIEKLLSEAQYIAFVEKRDQIKLRRKGMPQLGFREGGFTQRDEMRDMPPPDRDNDFE